MSAKIGVRIKATEIAGYATLPDSPLTVDEARALIDLSMSEAAWQVQVEGVVRGARWVYWHDQDSRESDAGLPDLICWRDRLIFIELKREKGRLSVGGMVRDRRTGRLHFRKGQAETVIELLDAGQEVYVLRPSDFGALVAILTGTEPDRALMERARAEAVGRIAA